VRDLNPATVLKYRYLIIENPEAALAIVATRMTAKSAEKKEKPAKVMKARATKKAKTSASKSLEASH